LTVENQRQEFFDYFFALKKVIERLFSFFKTIFHSFFIHELLLFSNEFICPLGNLDAKTFEIKNLKLKGEAPVELR